MELDKYKKNLKIENNFVYSYNTKVAEIVNNTIIVSNYYSVTTNKHIRYVACELNLDVIRIY